ncbi:MULTISPECIES: DUF3149 domain-containing protein [Vogesella]|jgi:hypothetical protein|uniref:DUF3149 domain-containing protein n=3 Tax=Vogesella TaxID=57739 RepID=A0A495BCU1_VOGIN|nr:MULTISPECIES: DUF3149 domain-containing protein [Vogesella]MCQ4143669.1 DUF3149 domain-containing protein [Vogesella sp. AC12]MDC7689724.1 DUF3149 domain-containing protein [Vogesella indigofera]MDC7697710.1 DUF3149 domain-containing protein [Vogesella indigofera]MDC7700795.1 DUF3149 domain-containing protein [Vogesella indigofera]MDC7704824.1 DUF3149 domain-containing protein [Vogesella indigofera]
MELWKQLLSDDVGLLSVITIGVTSVIVTTIIVMFIKKVKNSDRK